LMANLSSTPCGEIGNEIGPLRLRHLSQPEMTNNPS
jgi:hypothetical protein